MTSNEWEMKLLHSLSELFPTVDAAATEIINLQSILCLPKGTEHFLTDIHGEYEAFSHVIRNGSGSVKKKINDVFGHTLSQQDKKALATLIYYPTQKMALIKQQESNIEDWYKITLYRLIEVCKCAASKYTRSKVRKALPKEFAYVIEELITEKSEVLDKEAYYDTIIASIISTGRAEGFIRALCILIRELVVDHIHILGDVFDRGPAPHLIMDCLMEVRSLDIQWGNHDIVWMGAAAGSAPCIATVIRNSVRYGQLDILEEGYGINMLPLATLAIDTYKGDPCNSFKIHGDEEYTYKENRVNVKMHKAITVIQFKLEGQLIRQRPEFHMEDRLLLDKVDYERGVITLDGVEYELNDKNFPTIDPADPYALNEEEADVVERLIYGFKNSHRLQDHVEFLLNRGNLYKVYNSNLLYHGCVPLNEDGSFREVEVFGKKYAGKALYDVLEAYVRKGFRSIDPEEQKKGQDIMWWIWCGKDSPLFGKDKMATYERAFIDDKATHTENKNPYYKLDNDVNVVNAILREFGLSEEHSHIINGHVPVRLGKGESPSHCDGKLLIIDGGFCKAYQKQTGIAGYTLIYNSWGMTLVAHDPFCSREEAIIKEQDIHSDKTMVMTAPRRLLVGDTDDGKRMKERIAELEDLLKAYRSGEIKEKHHRN